MEKTRKYILHTFVTLLFVGASLTGFSQIPSPPDGTSNSQSNKLGGNGAPIGSELFILLSLGAAYGGHKIYHLRKKLTDEI